MTGMVRSVITDIVFERDETFFWTDEEGEEHGPFVTHEEAFSSFTEYCNWIGEQA